MNNSRMLNKEQLQDLQTWSIVNDRIEQFENKFNLAMCRSLYGEDEGLRLFTHFRKDCTKSPFKQFETYLDSRQMNLLYDYLMTSILFDN